VIRIKHEDGIVGVFEDVAESLFTSLPLGSFAL